jgi:ABC-2 type transport system permease protein
MAMFTRIALSDVPTASVVISVAILAVSIVGVGIISAKIYRMGVLLYGKPPKMKEIIKMLKNSK